MPAHTPPSYFEKVKRDAEYRWQARRANREHGELFRAKFEEVRRSPQHIISELLQNAEDVSATRAEVSTLGSELVFRHNGRDFAEDEFDAFCTLGVSSKGELFTIGFMGVGSKSMFGVGDVVELHSDNLHVRFDQDSVTVPTWIPAASAHARAGWTTFVIPYRSDEANRRVQESASRWMKCPHSLALFRSLVDVNINKTPVRITRQPSKGQFVTSVSLAILAEVHAMEMVTSDSFSFPDDCLPEISRIRRMTKVPNGHVDVVWGDVVNGKVFVVLPTRMVLPVPFALNGPFLPDSTRDKVQDPEDSPTNNFLFERVGDLVASQIVDVVNTNELSLRERVAAYELLPPSDDEKCGELERNCLSAISRGVSRRLESEAFLLLADGSTAKPGEVVDIPGDLFDVWTPDVLRQLFCEGKKLLAPGVSQHAVDRMAAAGWVEALDNDDVSSILSSGRGVPRPTSGHQLHALWSYCDGLTRAWQSRGSARLLGVFPCTTTRTLHSGSILCRLSRELRERADHLWPFVEKAVKLLDQDAVVYGKCGSCSKEDKVNVEQFLTRAGVVGTTSSDRVVSAYWSAIGSDSHTDEENVRVVQLAVLLDASLPEDFTFVCRDGKRRLQSLPLVDPPAECPPQLFPDSWLDTHAISGEYQKQCAASDAWMQWLAKRTSVSVLAIPLERNVQFRAPRNELARRGATGSFFRD